MRLQRGWRRTNPWVSTTLHGYGMGMEFPTHRLPVLNLIHVWPNVTTYPPPICKIRKNVMAAVIPATSSTASTLAVAAIVTPYPVVYVAANVQSGINNDAAYSDSDDSNHVNPHCSPSCTMVILNAEIPASTVKQIKEKVGLAPFFEPSEKVDVVC